MKPNLLRPMVLCFSGHDPSGGAGVSADIESINANLAQPLTVVTALTSQNTAAVFDFKEVSSDWIIKQAMPVIEEFSNEIKAIKIGMLASKDNAETVLKICQALPDVPVVLDPILKSGNGGLISADNIFSSLQNLAIYAKIITPNLLEFESLRLSEISCQNVLLTMTDAGNEPTIKHKLSGKSDEHIFEYERIDYNYHGSGCTLSSAIAANLARQMPIVLAVKQALDYTWQVLKQTPDNGHVQLIPMRQI